MVDRSALVNDIGMKIRDAVAQDACEVMRRSIAELYVANPGNDPTILERWMGNKTSMCR
jgi:hypothetical protein